MPSYYDHADVVVRTWGPTCHLCGRGIDLTVRNGRGALQIDHVWPRSLGGCDHPQNLRPSHRTCNASRGNRVLPGARRPVCGCAAAHSRPAVAAGRRGRRGALRPWLLPARGWLPNALWWLTGIPLVVLTVALTVWLVKAAVTSSRG